MLFNLCFKIQDSWVSNIRKESCTLLARYPLRLNTDGSFDLNKMSIETEKGIWTVMLLRALNRRKEQITDEFQRAR